jgi:hypothetical protein
MWPAIAVEGSDAFDAVQRGAGYVFQRPWNVAFYSIVLLLFGAPLFLVVRALALLLLKLTHAATDSGLSVAGAFTSRMTDTVSPLDAMWRMPAWQDLSIIPTVSGVPFWGEFGFAPLSTSEAIGSFLIAIWVFLVVGAVGGFIVSYFFCGSTEMYTLLRRDVDGVDYDELNYEGDDQELDYLAPAAESKPGVSDADKPAAQGTALPVVSPPGGSGIT